jgi:hypothetical protein
VILVTVSRWIAVASPARGGREGAGNVPAFWKSTVQHDDHFSPPALCDVQAVENGELFHGGRPELFDEKFSSKFFLPRTAMNP